MDRQQIFRILVAANYHIAAMLLIVAGVYKILDPYPGEIMGALLEQYIISPAGYRIIKLLMPWFEIGIGIIALSGWRAERTAKVLGIIYLIFSGLILYVSEGRLASDLGCGCFGDGDTAPVYLLLLRNLLLALFLFFLKANHRDWTLNRLFTGQVRSIQDQAA